MRPATARSPPSPQRPWTCPSNTAWRCTYSSFKSLDPSILETPLIDCKCYFFNYFSIIFGLADKKIEKTFKETVIGIKIIDTKTSDHLNGDYTIKKNFLNTNEINIHFEAQIWRSISYFVIIYLHF